MDCSPPGSSIYGIFQARVLEWGAIAFSNINYWDSLNKQITQVLYDLLLKYGPWTSSTGITWELEMKTLRPHSGPQWRGPTLSLTSPGDLGLTRIGDPLMQYLSAGTLKPVCLSSDTSDTSVATWPLNLGQVT